MSFTVAIDGPAAAGKGTIARAVAAHFGFAHLDSGLLYRVVGKKVTEGADAVEAARALVAEDLTAEGLRTAAVAQAASHVAAIPDVRSAFLDFQRAFARRLGGAVVDGRDIGSVICPEAEAKLFVTASSEVRAERRLAELLPKDPTVTYEKVLHDVQQRDRLDRERATSPLIQAEDAIVLDTSAMSIEAAVARAIEIVEGCRNATT